MLCGVWATVDYFAGRQKGRSWVVNAVDGDNLAVFFHAVAQAKEVRVSPLMVGVVELPEYDAAILPRHIRYAFVAFLLRGEVVENSGC